MLSAFSVNALSIASSSFGDRGVFFVSVFVGVAAGGFSSTTRLSANTPGFSRTNGAAEPCRLIVVLSCAFIDAPGVFPDVVMRPSMSARRVSSS